MEYKSPQQQIFDAVYSISERLGYATFDYLPPKQQAYPFVYVGEQTDQNARTKSGVYGLVQQTVIIYHDYKKRRELTDMRNELEREFRLLKHTDNFYVSCRNVTGQTLIDNSTGQPLLQGIIEVEFRFN
jgi:hypothetical protein